MYNNNETPIVYEDKVDSSRESNKQKNNENVTTLTYENGVWRPATNAEHEEIQRQIEEMRKDSDLLGKKASECVRIAESLK